MSDFKVGDRVRYTGNKTHKSQQFGWIGKLGTIKGIRESNKIFAVKFDDINEIMVPRIWNIEHVNVVPKELFEI